MHMYLYIIIHMNIILTMWYCSSDHIIFNTIHDYLNYLIDGKIAEFLGEDPEVYFAAEMAQGQDVLPAETVFEPHIMIDPATGKEYIARTEQEHMDYAALGYYHSDEE